MTRKIRELHQKICNKSEQIEGHTTFLDRETLYQKRSNHPKWLCEFSIILINSQATFNWIETSQVSGIKVNAQEMLRKVWKKKKEIQQNHYIKNQNGILFTF